MWVASFLNKIHLDSKTRQKLHADEATGDVEQESTKSVLTSQSIPLDWFYRYAAPGAASTCRQRDMAVWEAKHDEIVNCLAGQRPELQSANAVGDGDDYYVNLWELRDLALRPGGLLCPQLRKRAWPTLLACHTKVLLNSASDEQLSPGTGMALTNSLGIKDARALRKDIERTVWNIEDHLMASKRQQQQQEEQMRLFLQQQRRRVSFAPLATMLSEDNLEEVSPTSFGSDEDKTHSFDEEDSPREARPLILFPKQYMDTEGKRIRAAPSMVNCATMPEQQQKEDDSTILTHDDLTVRTSGDDNTLLTQESSINLSSRVVGWRKTSKQEQKVLFNVISSLLRTPPEPNPYFEDDAYHYSTGLHDLTAVLMINIESPSITTLVLQQLATTHLRDTTRPDRTVVAMAVETTLMPLVHMVDPDLHEHLTNQAHHLNLGKTVRSWVSCWFSQDVTDIRVASRIVDVLIVSHPLAILYLVVALLTHQRRRILCSDDDNAMASTLHATVRGLAAQTLTVDQVETIIAAALGYMKQIPPQRLIEHVMDSSLVGDRAGAVALFQAPPAWTTLDEVPNDWTLLQRASALRMHGTEQRQVEPCPSSSKHEASDRYPLAMIAVGRSPSSRKQQRSNLVVLSLLIVAAMAATGALVSFGSRKQQGLVLHHKPPPEKQEPPVRRNKLFRAHPRTTSIVVKATEPEPQLILSRMTVVQILDFSDRSTSRIILPVAKKPQPRISNTSFDPDTTAESSSSLFFVRNLSYHLLDGLVNDVAVIMDHPVVTHQEQQQVGRAIRRHLETIGRHLETLERRLRFVVEQFIRHVLVIGPKKLDALQQHTIRTMEQVRRFQDARRPLAVIQRQGARMGGAVGKVFRFWFNPLGLPAPDEIECFL